MTLLAAQDVSMTAGDRPILSDVSLMADAGECVAIVGPNGAGKSTLLRILSGTLRPHSGTVRLRGRDIGEFGIRELAQHRAVLSQSITVAFPFTVAEIVAMGAGDAGGAKVDALVDDALRQVELSDFAHRSFPTLSGGEQQRAHFARVLVQMACGEALHGPGLLLLDEPTASLDLKHQLMLAASARQCASRGVAVLAILHDLNLATLFADRIIVLERGRMLCVGPPRQVVTDDVLRNAFGVEDAVNRTPPPEMPFVLPHAARPTLWNSR